MLWGLFPSLGGILLLYYANSDRTLRGKPDRPWSGAIVGMKNDVVTLQVFENSRKDVIYRQQGGYVTPRRSLLEILWHDGFEIPRQLTFRHWIITGDRQRSAGELLL